MGERSSLGARFTRVKAAAFVGVARVTRSAGHPGDVVRSHFVSCAQGRRVACVSTPLALSRLPEAGAEPVAPGWLRPPPLPAGVVQRPRLSNRLEELAQQPLTVVSAPTGYGKTTLLVSWAAATKRRVAWASLGARGLDAGEFWTVVAAALGGTEPRLRFDLGQGDGSLEPAVRTASARGSLSDDLTLVLDGYEHASRAGLDPDLRRFLDRAPATLHVVVSTRGEPGLALPLRRARATVGELGAADLRLDEGETAAVLPRGVDAASFARRTEGWPAAAYLGALAARTAANPDEALRSFSGAAAEIADYLRLELLDGQPDPVRSFLLETSLLDRLTAPICDALLQRHDSEATLGTLVREGSFVVPVDGARREYRYVRPVVEFLRAELLRVAPDRLPELHRRAAAACERAGRFEEAASHARRGSGADEAARLLSRRALELVRHGRTEHLERLLTTRGGAVASQRRPALGAELRRLAEAGTDVPALAKAAERVAALSAGLPSGPVRSVVRSTARAGRAYALLLSGSLAEAHEAGAAAYATTGSGTGAPAAQAAAVASLAASRLGLGAAAAPLARASASALRRRGISTGSAAALARLAEAAVVERGDSGRAERLCADAARRAGDPATRALALLQLARLRPPAAASAALDEARRELSRCSGASLLETMLAERDAELGTAERAELSTGELSPAEQRVLRLLATRLSRREVASELYVSVNTVKTHTRGIYGKLGVRTRAAAVEAGRDLNLV
jgi:LuxR family maltose regulon positive regulatory protein